MLTAAALVLRDGQSDALIVIIAGISFQLRHNWLAAPHQQNTRCPHPRCPSTLHPRWTPELTGIFTATRLKRLCRIQFIRVLFTRFHRGRQNLQRCQSSLLALFQSRASNPTLRPIANRSAAMVGRATAKPTIPPFSPNQAARMANCCAI